GARDDPVRGERVAQGGAVLIGHLALLGVGTERGDRPTDEDPALVHRVAQPVGRVAAHDDGSGLHHEPGHVAGVSADDQGAALHGDPRSGPRVARYIHESPANGAPLAVDHRRRRHRSHQRTSLACSSLGTSEGSGNTRRRAISSEDSTTISSFSAYSRGFVANWSRASPTPWAVEIR